ncbi:MAG: hypothetical protein LBQ66_07910, partial [Planctomycetaceae bacterium]|nr:hypothetical protein [Planctomycetaceae bacterium]
MSSAQETLSQDDFYQDASQGGSRVTVIESRLAWFGLNFSEIWRYRYLIWLYIYRDFVVLYKQTVLGMVWW